MFVRLRYAVIAALLLLVNAAPALAQLIPGWQAKQFTLERIDSDRIVLQGETEIVGEGPNAGQQIFADHVEWNIRTGEFTATGNVLVVSPTSRLAAERAVFNTKTQLGTFETASGIASLGAQGVKDRSMFGTLEPDVYFYGKTIEKIGRDKYRIRDGGFTTCVQPTPRWDIVSGSATIDLGDYAILRNAVMRVKNVPVFYLPVLYYPIQDDDRATGFLLPTYGTSLYWGSSLSNGFFWAINRSMDATFMHDWYTKRGQGYGAEYRYMSGPLGSGNLSWHFLNEKASEIELATGGTELQPARKSFQTRGQLVQPLRGRLTARANVDYFSDVQTQQLYNMNIYQSTLSRRSYDGTVTGAWGAVNLTARYNRTESFLSSTQTITQGAEPGALVTFSSTRIGQWPLYFAMNGEASRNVYIDRIENPDGTERIRDNGAIRFDAFPTLRAPINKWPFLNIIANLGVRTTYFSESLAAPPSSEQVPVGLWRRYAEMRADVTGPVFTRIFTPQNALADRLKHLIEPTFSLARVTSINNQDLIPNTGSAFDKVIGGVTRMSYGVTNRILVRKERARTPDMDDAMAASLVALNAAPRELLSASLTQSYYTNEEASKYAREQFIGFGQRPPSKFGPVNLTVRSAPTLFSTATFVANYNAEEGRLESIQTSGGVNYPKVNAQVGLSSTKYGEAPRTNTFDSRTTVSFDSGRIGGTYTMNWDISGGRILNQRWTGFYNAQCCGLMMEFQKFAYSLGTTIPLDQRFNISFTLAGIGSFSNFFGAFGGGRY
jgi:LPS-assembly protein